jgi:hypothetical protein
VKRQREKHDTTGKIGHFHIHRQVQERRAPNKHYFQNQQQCRHEVEQKPPSRAHEDGDIYRLKQGIATKYK